MNRVFRDFVKNSNKPTMHKTPDEQKETIFEDLKKKRDKLDELRRMVSFSKKEDIIKDEIKIEPAKLEVIDEDKELELINQKAKDISINIKKNKSLRQAKNPQISRRASATITPRQHEILKKRNSLIQLKNK